LSGRGGSKGQERKRMGGKEREVGGGRARQREGGKEGDKGQERNWKREGDGRR